MPNQRSDETGKIWDFYGSLGKQADRWREPETLCFMRIISTHVLQVSHTLPRVRVVGHSGTAGLGLRPWKADVSGNARLSRLSLFSSRKGIIQTQPNCRHKQCHARKSTRGGLRTCKNHQLSMFLLIGDGIGGRIGYAGRIISNRVNQRAYFRRNHSPACGREW